LIGRVFLDFARTWAMEAMEAPVSMAVELATVAINAFR